ncbi:hypothetical protein Ahy_A09g046193 [Arachis hypogaea]|uniref:Root hair defective 3 GTP-binding protein n=1 Tax=Arachis hypogaea TaxID=3818 RepID=A0A445BP34_ARAHY|nr:hypothetical protein Ahy_A09g046192 [Arachis hypogaea]RYR40439.1 hypothetical protein Ahy_A09g046193 [Arachis hypogaea]
MMSKMVLPGLLSLSTKFVPTVMNLMKKLADEGADNNTRRNPPKGDYKAANDGSAASSSSSSNVTLLDNGTKHNRTEYSSSSKFE